MKKLWIIPTLLVPRAGSMLPESVTARDPDRQARNGALMPSRSFRVETKASVSESGAPGLIANEQEAGPADDRKIIRTIQLSLGVDEPDEVSARVQQLAEARGGYVSLLSSGNGGHYQIQIRVPADAVTAVMAELKGMATIVDSENLRVTMSPISSSISRRGCELWREPSEN